MAVPHRLIKFLVFNRSVVRIQGGYFFIFLITSIKAINTIAYVSKYIMSVILNIAPFHKGVRTTAAVPLRLYSIISIFALQELK